MTGLFVLDKTENPHPVMLAGAIEARRTARALGVTVCDRCRSPHRRSIPAYWNNHYCPPCAQHIAGLYDRTGWPTPPWAPNQAAA